MPLYVLEIEGAAPLSINAHDDEGAEILTRSWLDGGMSPGAVVRLMTEDGGRVVLEATVGDLMSSKKAGTRRLG